MLFLFMFIKFVFLSSSDSSDLEVYSLSFCTDWDIQSFKYILDDEGTGDIYEIVGHQKKFTDVLINFSDVYLSSTLKDSNSYIYKVHFTKPLNKDIKLIMLNKSGEEIMFVKTITSSKTSSGFEFEFSKSNMKFNQHISKQTKMAFKELNKTNPNDEIVFILGESNLGLMNLLLDFEFYSITNDLKEKVLKPMVKSYEDIRIFLKNNTGNLVKMNLISEKINAFYLAIKDASAMKYELINSEDLELAYFDSKNMRIDENKIYEAKQSLISFTLGKIISAIEDIISEVQVIEGSEEFTKVRVNIANIVADLSRKHETILGLNKNIQEYSFSYIMTKKNKIRQCLNLLKCDYNQLKIIIKISELTRDFYMNFLNVKKHNETCNHFFSLVCVLYFQKSLYKDCINNPTVKNLTNYMNFKNVENYKVKNLHASWILLKESFKNLKNDILDQYNKDKTYESFKTRYEDLETISLEVMKKLEIFMIESFYLSDLSLKSDIFTYLLVNNQDVLNYKSCEKKLVSN